MNRFHAKLDAALALVEMAQLAKHGHHINPPKGIGWTFSIGKGNKRQSEHTSESNPEKVRDYFTTRLSNDYKHASPHMLDDLFGVSSLQELLASIELTERTSTDSSFNDNDRKALTSPKTWQRVAELLSSGPGEYNWNIFGLDSQYARDELGFDLNGNLPALKAYLAQEYPDIDLDNSITFIKGGTSGDALDADMLIHTAAHAVTSVRGNGRIGKVVFDAFDDLVSKMRTVLVGAIDNELWDDFGVDKAKYERFEDLPYTTCLLAQFCHFKAAKSLMLAQDKSMSPRRREAFLKRSVGNATEEIFHEMISVFIKRNRVRFEPNEFCFITNPTVLGEVAKVRDLINETMKTMLDRCVGQIILD